MFYQPTHKLDEYFDDNLCFPDKTIFKIRILIDNFFTKSFQKSIKRLNYLK